MKTPTQMIKNAGTILTSVQDISAPKTTLARNYWYVPKTQIATLDSAAQSLKIVWNATTAPTARNSEKITSVTLTLNQTLTKPASSRAPARFPA